MTDYEAPITHDDLRKIVKAMPGDYTGYGGTVERWASNTEAYPDCSCGCRFFLPVEGRTGADWGVCCKPGHERAGMLTFEHQAGYGCFEYDEGLSRWLDELAARGEIIVLRGEEAEEATDGSTD